MNFECKFVDFDHRLKCYVVSARATYEWYLDATNGAENNLGIQRDIIKGQKTYQTLRQDLKRGCVLPPVVIAINQVNLPEKLQSFPEEPFLRIRAIDLDELHQVLVQANSSDIQIIDGLQRTNAIRSVANELQAEDKSLFLSRPLRFEIWLNIGLDALAYRMLLLNAGQKPMSMKHQIEILSDSMRLALQDINGLEIIRSMDKRRRVQPGQFQLSVLTSAFQAWLQKSPNVDLRNAVTEQLLSDEAIEELGRGLSPNSHRSGDRFKQFIAWLVQVDRALGPANVGFFGNETVVQAITAVISKFSSAQETEARCTEAQQRLLADIAIDANALRPDLFEEFRREIDPKKQNVGEASRLLAFRAFSEYIISGGATSMQDAWTFASQYLK